MSTNSHIDHYDRIILKILSQEGRLPVTELAARVGLSKTPCSQRLKRLVNEGYIQGFRAMIDPARLGMDQVVFVETADHQRFVESLVRLV